MRFRRRLSPEARVDLIPMIDVVLQLVIFFMVTSTFVMVPGINLVLPTSSTAEPVVMTNLVITVSSQDAIYINRNQYSLATLDHALADIAADRKEKIESVVIEGDRDVSYDLMIRVLDRLRGNGFTNVSLKLRENPEARR